MSRTKRILKVAVLGAVIGSATVLLYRFVGMIMYKTIYEPMVQATVRNIMSSECRYGTE